MSSINTTTVKSNLLIFVISLVFFYLLCNRLTGGGNCMGFHRAATEGAPRETTYRETEFLVRDLEAADFDRYFICLFTTFKAAPGRSLIHSKTVRNWSALRPFVRPVLFSTSHNGELVDLARRYRWDIIASQRVNQYGTPMMKEMFYHAYTHFESDFYAYANGDLLFNMDLINTLKGIKEHFMRLPATSAVPFVIGKRCNYIVNVSNPNDEIWKPNITKATSKATPPFRSDAIDYFITTKHGFPWNKMPDLVIGRNGFDQYLVLMANYFNLTVIDTTQTQCPLHLMGPNFLYTHRTTHVKDKLHNLREIRLRHPRSVPWASGTISAAHVETVKYGNMIFVHHRRRSPTRIQARWMQTFDYYSGKLRTNSSTSTTASI